MKKRAWNRFLSVLLACVMLLNVPMSALAFDGIAIDSIEVAEDPQLEIVDEELLAGGAQSDDSGAIDSTFTVLEDLTEEPESEEVTGTAEVPETSETEEASGMEAAAEVPGSGAVSGMTAEVSESETASGEETNPEEETSELGGISDETGLLEDILVPEGTDPEELFEVGLEDAGLIAEGELDSKMEEIAETEELSDENMAETLLAEGEETEEGQSETTAETGKVTAVKLDRSRVYLALGGTTEAVLTASVEAEEGEEQIVTWSSSAEEIATVSGGTVTAVAAGTAVITAQAGDQKAECTVTVASAVAEEVAVHVTISNAGSVVMAQQDVTVSDYDKDGRIDVDDALCAAHAAAYTGGVAGYGCSYTQYGLSLTRLWGDESGVFGYWVNDSACSSLEDAVSAGDFLAAYVYQDKTGWSDAYAAFGQKEYRATAGKAFTAAVKKAGYDENWNTVFTDYADAILHVYDSSMNPLSEEKYTTEGSSVTIQEVGTYYLTATGAEGTVLVPAVAKVTVKEERQYLSSIKLGAVYGKFTTELLVEEGKYEYEYPLGARYKATYMNVELSADAPEGSTATAVYNLATTGKSREIQVLSGKTGYLSNVAAEGGATATVTVKVGVEGDMQEYTVTMPRVSEPSVASFTEEDGTELSLLDNIYYVPAESTSKTLKLKVSAYGANVTVNGETAEDGAEYVFTPQWGEDNTCDLKITAWYDEARKTELFYVIKKMTEDTQLGGTCGDALTWTLKNGVLTISGTGQMTQYNSNVYTPWYPLSSLVKSVVIEDGVESIGTYAFMSSHIEKLTLPENTALHIGYYAFFQNTGLKEVKIPAKVTMAEYAFYGCKALEKVTVEGGTGESAFRGCTALKELVIGNSCTSIAKSAFSACTALESIVIPANVQNIGTYAFEDCTALKSADLSATEASIDGYMFGNCTALENLVLNSKNYTVKDKVVYSADGTELIFCLSTREGSVTVAEGVTKASEAAFNQCAKLTEVILPQGLTAVSKSMFSNCSALEKIVIPDTVTEIGSKAFNNCTSLKEAVLPKNLTALGTNTFYKCTALTSCSIPEGVTEIPKSMFYNCSALERVVIPASVTSIGNNAFKNANLDYVLFGGTGGQWDGITGTKPEPTGNPGLVLFCAKQVGDLETDAPTIKTQPADQELGLNEDAANALRVKAAKLTEEGASYYFSWYKNTAASTTGSVNVWNTAGTDGMSSSCTPATDTAGTAYYYCVVEKVSADGTVTYAYSDIAAVVVSIDDFEGSGTEKKPYLIQEQKDLVKLHDLVEGGMDTSGIYYQLTDDITLPDEWTPIGPSKEAAFKGILDGNNKTITVPAGGLPLLGNVKGAEVRDLNIYGEKIAGHGLVNNFEGVGLSGVAIVIDHVTLKKGSSTLKSGLIGANMTTNPYAGCSAGFTAVIRSCVIEDGVVIGYDKNQAAIGSIAGRMQGIVENCVSHATVYGTNYVGGIIGVRDNSMGTCTVTGCTFDGTVEASGDHVGGIVGGGYNNSSAPNAVRISVNNCFAAGSITGADKVGGILGGDSMVAQAWNEYTFKGNTFSGTVKATDGTSVGGIIGFYDSLNKMDDIANNTYAEDCGASRGIGAVAYVDTNCESHETESGSLYINTENDTSGCSAVTWCNWKTGYNRTDDPLGADADKLAAPSQRTEPYVTELTVSGDYRTTYYMGEDFDRTGMVFTARWSDNTTTSPEAAEITVEGFDTDKWGRQEVKLSYGGASVTVVIRVLLGAKVTFSLLGDTLHDSDTDGNIHTLASGNLATWVPETVYYVDLNSTVYDVMLLAASEWNFEIDATDSQYGTYVKAITMGEVRLEELDNGWASGWMYTVNGIHPDVSAAARRVENGDAIIFHYTDNYTEEESLLFDQSQAAWAEEKITALPAANRLTADDAAAVRAAREAYDSLTEAQKALVSADVLAKLEAAEARMADLTHVHTWDSGKVVSAATESAAEVRKYTCTACGATKTESVGEKLPHTHKWDNGKTVSAATVSAAEVRKYTCTACGATKTESVGEKLPHTHKWDSGKTVSAATVSAAEVRKYTCTSCGATKKESVGKKLTAVLKLPGSLKTIQLKEGAKTAFEVTMAAGDSVKSVKSSDKTYMKTSLDKTTGKITIKGVEAGNAKLTIKLASGKTGTYTVKVVSSTVKTTAISVTNVNNEKLTLKKGKTKTLKTTLKPFTSTQAITYKSSDKSVATITSSGKIKAAAPGKAVITVTSGSESVKITVTVPGITVAKTSISVKKGKTKTLSPKIYGISGKVTYTSSDKKVATVTSKGKIKGIKKGTAKITIQAGSYKKTVKVTVK